MTRGQHEDKGSGRVERRDTRRMVRTVLLVAAGVVGVSVVLLAGLVMLLRGSS